jgi:hypothetical protein
VAYDPVPWFWTDQYDRKLQLAGRVGPSDTMAVVDGLLDDRRFAVLFGRDGRVTGAAGMNRPAVVMRWRNRLAAGSSWDEALAAT